MDAMTRFTLPDVDPEAQALMRRLDAAVAADVRLQAFHRAADTEARVRALIVDRHPHIGPFLVERPRAAKAYFKLRPKTKPVVEHHLGGRIIVR